MGQEVQAGRRTLAALAVVVGVAVLREGLEVVLFLYGVIAAGLASQAVAFLQQGGYADAWSTPLWNSSAVLPEDGILGRVLHTRVGYTDQPTGMQIVAYLAVVAAILELMRVASGASPGRVAAG